MRGAEHFPQIACPLPLLVLMQVQLPNHLTSVLGGQDKVDFDYSFGKHNAMMMMNPISSSSNRGGGGYYYDLVVHCGGCMLNPQQMDARVADLMAAGVPATNYGLLLSRIQSPQTLSRVLKPWGITYDHDD
jgi:Hydrogen maturase F tetramerization domain